MLPLVPRSFRRTFLRPKPLFIAVLVILLLDTYFITSPSPPPTRNAVLSPSVANQKIFIAAMARNSEYVLRLYWSTRLVNLVKALGPENVFVSVLESGSAEDTKAALKELEGKLNALGVKNKIVLGIDSEEHARMLASVPEEGKRKGWVFTGREKPNPKKWELRRIPYLAEARNTVMEPMLEQKVHFDKVLWINDVIFTTEDVLTLLSTRDGDYAAACALDWNKNPESYYDTFALRDIQGHKTATQSYPFFQHTPSISLLHTLSPIPVQSCWNGLIALSSSPFYPPSLLQFRGVPDSLAKHHVEGSECCLIHADNPLRASKGNWINPNVRVSYNASTYSKLNGGVEVRADAPYTGMVEGREGGDGSVWPAAGERFRGTWWNRGVRWVGWVKSWSEERMVRGRVKKWKVEGRKMKLGEERVEMGVECLVNEMQVLFDNGWQHV